ncbi:MAG TPA: type II TA system antitoxin MqsA family protein [Gemmatimonadaceae bacterium]|nr:type II TA system antitoxin MqsA family protein [Gemmatimonadaceae bacterium]
MSELSLDGQRHQKCGGTYARAVESATIRVSGMAATVERELYRCGSCGHERWTLEQREAAEQRAVDAIRNAHGLLAPREIRQLRTALGLTHEQLGDLLYGTPRGIVEGWERGRYLQNAEADAMLRSLTDREVLERRAARAGVVLPDPEAVHGVEGEDAPR